MEGKDGFANKERLKNLITEHQTKINEKNMKAYNQTNTSRIFIMSNNTNPIEIPNGDRRFAVFEADRIKPPASHWNEMRELMESDDENEGGGKAVLTNQEFNELKNDINALRDTNISKELLNTLMALITQQKSLTGAIIQDNSG